MILDKIVDKKRVAIEKRKKFICMEEIIKKSENMNKDFTNEFKKVFLKNDFIIIGEFKKASPSRGIIVENFDIDEIKKIYEKMGVQAYSVLTEEEYFLGKDEYIKELKNTSNVPILRKDFIIDKYQIYEASILGASAVLLIVAVLGKELKSFYELTKKLNLEALVEIHNEEELKIALDSGVDIIGINNRNLKTFKTDINTTRDLINKITKDKIIVSESGIKTLEDIEKVKNFGANAVLIGECFMRNINNIEFKNKIREFLINVNKNMRNN
ncbi:indole-3-glycerol phosphate synthase [Clostridium cavendishii DSM 21758]|uniref:Indole-3-glycerol phosphate synthase n=1 Tax=Clostridium cavendishii DSM 21758 TaxID=1121302 RepID=A0A1M6I5U3_9CLOT|nr:indole-3-glycerol phosphate synthase TrpC [Clostridium cavendishii]SHJ29813.1 indole-3-glycerol phosphate synthase [Clostridium cavendishii DSM 21758]